MSDERAIPDRTTWYQRARKLVARRPLLAVFAMARVRNSSVG
jgi:hypothetical protein